MGKFVKVSLSRVKDLLNCEDQLSRLEDGGVDNWQGYEECWEDYNSEVSNAEVEGEFTIFEE